MPNNPPRSEKTGEEQTHFLPHRDRRWKFRDDTTPVKGDSAVVKDGDLLRFFREHAENSASERRASPRYPATADRAWLGRQEGDKFRITAVSIANISRGGVMLTTQVMLGVDEICWLSLAPLCTVLCVRTRVVGVTRLGVGFEVRLRFEKVCPDQLYQTVVNGPSDPSSGR